MKHLIYFIAIALFFACESSQTSEVSTVPHSVDPNRPPDTVYLVRNTVITPANAYNDLFLDSANIEQIIQQKQVSADDAQRLRSFYNYRNGQFAWFNSDGFSEQALGFWNLRDEFEKDTVDKTLRKRMDTLLNLDTLTVRRFDTSLANTEIALTLAYLRFYHNHRDKLPFAKLSPEKLIPVKRENEIALADSIAKQLPDSSSADAGVAQYALLKQKLQLYSSVAKQGGWQPLNIKSKRLKKNVSSPDVALLKKRLQQSGDYSNTDTSKLFNDSLEIAIKNYQQRNGMKPSGVISDSLIKSLNVPAAQRLRQLIVNLNRMQWMPSARELNYIMVNIPDFMLTVFENGQKVFDMPVVVGKEGTNTMMFSGDMNQIVFSPYWKIPASIVQKEILPAMKADPGYLKKHRMEIVGKNDSLPEIRQLPGGDNFLGDVKFLFPNRYDIYFHDTKSKEIFKQDKRAVSHGCIRLAEADKMANYLLRNKSGWTPQKINEAMNSGKEQYVKLEKPVPVVITYFTAWVDETGQLNFRDDIYGHDKNTGQMMFAANTSTTSAIANDSASRKK